MNSRLYDIALGVLEGYPQLEGWIFNDRELEEFAGLLIAECIQVVQSQKLDLEPYPDEVDWTDGVWNSALTHAAGRIKGHWGINENSRSE